MKNETEEKYIKMTTKPVGHLVGEFAIPSIVSMLITSIYSLVDTYFVGNIDTQSTAALGIVFSYMALVQAFSFFFGHGSGNYISRALGSRNTEGAGTMAACGFYTSILTGCAFAVLGFLFTRPILRFLGATETIMPAAIGYFRYILLGTPFIVGTFVLNNQMRLQGNAFMSMIGISIGAVLNVILDPIFIFALDMGVAGAGLATAISEAVSFFIMLSMTGMRGGIKIRLRNFRPSMPQYREIVAGGLPSLARQGLGCVAAICLNQMAGNYGDSAIAAFSIVNRVIIFVSSALIGFGQGFQPVCGFNFGAERYDRVRKAFWFSASVMTAYCIVFAATGILFAPGIVSIFRAGDAEVIRYGSIALRWQCAAFPLVGIIVLSNMYLQNIRRVIPAVVVAMSRQGIFFIPLLFILESLAGIDGLLVAQPISDVISFALALPLSIAALKSMGVKASDSVSL